MKKLFYSLAIMVIILCSPPAYALDLEKAEHIVISAGIADVLRDAESEQYGVEYKSEAVFQKTWDRLVPFTMHTRPMIGIYGTTDGARYIFGGAAIDVPLSERVNLAMHAVVGHYSDGDDFSLGGPLSFREGIGLEYLYDSGARIGFSFDHNSNAFIYDINPGTETLRATYSHPVNFVK